MKRIIVEILGGVATVMNGDTGVEVEVRDYDFQPGDEEGRDEDELIRDDSGNPVGARAIYAPENPLPETHVELQNAVVRAALAAAEQFISVDCFEKTHDSGAAQQNHADLLQAIRSATLIMEGRKNVEV